MSALNVSALNVSTLNVSTLNVRTLNVSWSSCGLSPPCQSIEDFTRVLELDPNHANAAYARGACYNRKGDFDEAISDYQLVCGIVSQVMGALGASAAPFRLDRTFSHLCMY